MSDSKYSFTVTSEDEDVIQHHAKGYDAFTFIRQYKRILEDNAYQCSGEFLEKEFDRLATDLGLSHLL